jgi:kanamycin kinase
MEQNKAADTFDKSHFPDSFGYASAEEAWTVVEKHGHLLKSDTLLHGDYCLPNVILDDWRFSGFIDLDCAGVGDRHVDIFWGIWTLWFNLKTDKYRERFIDAYGRDKVDEDMLRVVAAAEVFG